MNKLLVVLCLILISFYSSSSPISAEKLYKYPDNHSFKLSPSGRYISAMTRAETGYFLNFYDRENNLNRESVQIGANNKVTEYLWLNDHYLWLTVRTRGRESVMLIHYENDELTLHRVSASGTLLHSYPMDSSKVLLMRTTGRRLKSTELVLVSIDDLVANNLEQVTVVKSGSNDFDSYFYEPFNDTLFGIKLDRKDQTATLQYTPLLENKWQTLLEIDAAMIDLDPVSLLDQETMAVLTNQNTDKIVLQEYNFAKKEFGEIIYQHPKYDLTGAVYNDLGQLVSVSFLKHGLVQFQYFEKDTSIQARRLSKTFEGSEVFTIDTSDEGQVSLLYLNGASTPGAYLLYDHKADVIEHLLDEYNDLKHDFAESTLLKLTSEDGTDIEAFLSEPNGKINHNTLLVMPHGGPIGVREYDYFNKEVQYYVSRGFSVLRVNFRGSSGFGKSFQQKAVGEFGKLIEKDISLAVSHVTAQNNYKHICSIGASYGGYSAAMLAIQNPALYDCIVGAFGIYDLPLLFNASNLRSGEEFAKEISEVVGEYDDTLYRVSPVNLVQKIEAPMLLIAGRKDDRADFEHSNRLKYLLKRLGKPVETMFYKNTGHGHANWKGDMHQSAFTYNYIMKTLSLDFPDPSQLSESEMAAIGYDFAMLGDEYRFGHYSDTDEDKALAFYKQAVKYNHGRSAHNIGAHYQSGQFEERDISKAIAFYKKAADMGYEGAHLRLGRLFMEANLGSVDWQQAKVMFETAHEMEDSAETALWLARYFCSTPLKDRDIDKCLALMDTEKYMHRPNFNASKIEALKRETLAWAYTATTLDNQELQKIKQSVIDLVQLNEENVSLDLMEEGRFHFVKSEKFGKNAKRELVQSDNELVLDKTNDEKIGLYFNVDKPGLNSAKDKSALSAKVTVLHKDNTQSHQLYLLYGSLRDVWSLVTNTALLENGDTVSFELFDVNQNKLYERSYSIAWSNE